MVDEHKMADNRKTRQLLEHQEKTASRLAPVAEKHLILGRALKVAALFLRKLSSGFMDSWVKTFFKKHRIPKGMILDVGCGQGVLLTELCRSGNVGVGIDFSNRLLQSPLTRVIHERIQCDAHHLPLRNQIFDIILCMEVLDHVTNTTKVLDEIKRVHKKEGLFFISVANANCMKYKYKGKHELHATNFSLRTFSELLHSRFIIMRIELRGLWIPVPHIRSSFHLPFRGSEKTATNIMAACKTE